MTIRRKVPTHYLDGMNSGMFNSGCSGSIFSGIESGRVATFGYMVGSGCCEIFFSGRRVRVSGTISGSENLLSEQKFRLKSFDIATN